MVLNVSVSLCSNIQYLFVCSWLSAVLLLSTTTGPSLTLGCTISVGPGMCVCVCVCVCVSVWLCDIHQAHQQHPPSGPVSTKTIRGRPCERCTWVCFFPPSTVTTRRPDVFVRYGTTACTSQRVSLAPSSSKRKTFHARCYFSCPFEMDDSSYSHRLCVCVCVCRGMEGRAHEGRQDKCRESRFSHFPPSLSQSGPIFRPRVLYCGY